MSRSTIPSIIAATLVVFAFAQNMTAQTTAFNYQGSLKDGGTAANGSFQMQFRLFDSLGGTGQIGSTGGRAVHGYRLLTLRAA